MRKTDPLGRHLGGTAVLIYSPAHGDLASTVPLFDEFMVRAIPQFNP